MLQIISNNGGIITAVFQNIQVRATVTQQPQKHNLNRSKIAFLYLQQEQIILAQFEQKQWIYRPYKQTRMLINQICTELNNLQT